ncbi:conserved hypothetical protein [Bathymodiolus platifrons methanotrophic gill symbiont]|uniref:DUF3465 domain-containing protein n=1 Tax=Bathymodiolus platifrons methanotrophic gill symbiont TaxID=113268 RepID=UPI000B408CF2|nr:DUF3465 domain-containing protein [Bathymodiolus platifrons methanotrophic gill symbiont]MCK5869828.1 DUF3465 domain-containing protein [Methyloprofundus sp.]TXK98055.1 DUF3465 domain-containing protein [Methylococcaceae bacterium CS5]TXK99049.1 DUF3465 domain-containing protein [Methylococcaceae bacterium CS4]TXL08531.1 DUF3465 domain-containing protein [Methylococcaceae bacterium CS3]TXL09147.1 DUF3465 domain-containing protein [Methylococcaceae bacterium CS1]TXL11331.1 DUF3465 domain-co
MKKLLILLIAGVLFAVEAYQQQNISVPESLLQASDSKEKISADNRDLKRAYEAKQSNLQVQGSGVVVKVLRDDLKGSRHQKFILQVGPGLTVLIAHNIDLAPRIDGLKKGDAVEFNGEYEWNSRGGVIHWTHKDPRGYHVSGWLKHDARSYQ